MFALGRGIAAHLHAVHAPWRKKQQELHKPQPEGDPQPSDSEQPPLKRRRILAGKQDDKAKTNQTEREAADSGKSLHHQNIDLQPTPQEQQDWDATVLAIVKTLEEEATRATGMGSTDSSSHPRPSASTLLGPGTDRTGQTTTSYRKSLPQFLQHAANGNLQGLQKMVGEAAKEEESQRASGVEPDGGNKQRDGQSESLVRSLLQTQDRHGSVAEHWAAGGGHLDCLEYLVQVARVYDVRPDLPKKKRGRRDGKTSLHYAARYGHAHCISYLLSTELYPVDMASGDGTTPLHLACFGGHIDVAKLLLEHGADLQVKNDWGCTVAHWLAMSSTNNMDCASEQIYREFCRYVQCQGVSFVLPQRQGHSAVHKAAQRRNHVLLQWLSQTKELGGAGLSEQDKVLAGTPDLGGHRPSDIWQNVGGEESTTSWLRTEMKW